MGYNDRISFRRVAWVHDGVTSNAVSTYLNFFQLMLILQPIGSHFLFVIIIAFAENSLIEWSIQLELRWDLEDEHALDKHFYNSRLKMLVNT